MGISCEFVGICDGFERGCIGPSFLTSELGKWGFRGVDKFDTGLIPSIYTGLKVNCRCSNGFLVTYLALY